MSDRPKRFQWLAIVGFGLFATFQTGGGTAGELIAGFLGGAFVASVVVILYNSKQGEDEQPAEAQS
ncbi:hypothetical protein [Halosimplex marinum]|uniref:hypothetical protein n=1 Tax=Halosimplex marinum TaxID=3396620 RepID=UPI003F5744BF